MDDEADNTLDIVSTLSSPKSPSQQPPQSTGQEESLEDILTRSSGDLIRTFAASVSQSATREASKSEEFKQGICGRNAHICWFLLSARPKLHCRDQKTLVESDH